MRMFFSFLFIVFGAAAITVGIAVVDKEELLAAVLIFVGSITIIQSFVTLHADNTIDELRWEINAVKNNRQMKYWKMTAYTHSGTRFSAATRAETKAEATETFRMLYHQDADFDNTYDVWHVGQTTSDDAYNIATEFIMGVAE